MKKSTLLMSSVLILLMLALIFYVRSLYIIPAAEAMTFFEPSHRMRNLFLNEASLLEADEGKGRIRVVYFWQNACACDELVKAHFLLLKEAYQQSRSDVQFYLAVLKGEPMQEGLLSMDMLPSPLLEIVKPDVEVTPSVAIWDKSGELVYFGPHNIGYVCNDDSSLLKKVVDSLLNKQVFSALSTVGDGCFCRVH